MMAKTILSLLLMISICEINQTCAGITKLKTYLGIAPVDKGNQAKEVEQTTVEYNNLSALAKVKLRYQDPKNEKSGWNLFQQWVKQRDEKEKMKTQNPIVMQEIAKRREEANPDIFTEEPKAEMTTAVMDQEKTDIFTDKKELAKIAATPVKQDSDMSKAGKVALGLGAAALLTGGLALAGKFAYDKYKDKNRPRYGWYQDEQGWYFIGNQSPLDDDSAMQAQDQHQDQYQKTTLGE